MCIILSIVVLKEEQHQHQSLQQDRHPLMLSEVNKRQSPRAALQMMAAKKKVRKLLFLSTTFNPVFIIGTMMKTFDDADV